MKRQPGWRARLTAALIACDDIPFSWETGDDCLLRLVARAVEAMTGEDFAAPYRGRYRDEHGARAVLAELGFASLSEALASVFEQIAPPHAQIGDIAVVDVPHGMGEASGIVTGAHIAMLGPKGRAAVHLRRASKAFRVP